MTGFGGLAQLGEHLLCKQGVVGSIPSTSTNSWFAVASRKFLAEGFVFANNLRLTSYDISLIFKNLEEVKKVIHANVSAGRPVRANA